MDGGGAPGRVRPPVPRSRKRAGAAAASRSADSAVVPHERSMRCSHGAASGRRSARGVVYVEGSARHRRGHLVCGQNRRCPCAFRPRRRTIFSRFSTFSIERAGHRPTAVPRGGVSALRRRRAFRRERVPGPPRGSGARPRQAELGRRSTRAGSRSPVGVRSGGRLRAALTVRPQGDVVGSGARRCVPTPPRFMGLNVPCRGFDRVEDAVVHLPEAGNGVVPAAGRDGVLDAVAAAGRCSGDPAASVHPRRGRRAYGRKRWIAAHSSPTCASR